MTDKALRESEGRYRVVAETASDAIMTIDESAKILFANPAAEKIFGYPVSELVGSSLTRLVPEYSGYIHSLGIAGPFDARRPVEPRQSLAERVGA